MTTQQNTTTAADLSISLRLDINNSYGQSTLGLVQEALISHRQTCLSEFFGCLKAGEYKEAYPWYQSAEDLSFLLDTILSETMRLAAQNYYAEELASNPSGYRNWAKNLPADKDDRYATFLKMVLPASEFNEPSTTDAPDEIKQQPGTVA
jgi:hypothetical protein